MSAWISNPTLVPQKRMDHIRPNPNNPLVPVQRDRSKPAPLPRNAKEVTLEELVAQGLDPRGLPSKGGKLTDINAPTPTKPSLPMPVRFQRPELWEDKAAEQHPLYRTSQHTYGQRPPAIQEMPNKYFGNSHTFTNTFAGGMHRDFGLNTSITKSKVNTKEEFGYY